MQSPGDWPGLGDLHFATVLLQQQHLLHLNESVVGITDTHCVNAVEIYSRSDVCLPFNFMVTGFLFSIL